MSEVVTCILKLTFGFISNKIRSYGAEKLQDGGLTDQKFRGFIVRELDDIKVKLNGLSRRELFASISSLQLGVERLNMSLEDSTKHGDPSTFELPKNEKQSLDTTNDGASTSTKTIPTKTSEAVDDAVALINAIGKLKVTSNKRFESARESFKDAGREAKLAFHNAALSTDERVRASDVRIASGILEHLEDPEFAASDCLQYLRELHDLPAIQEIFSVYIKAGIKSRIKSGFKKDSRTEIVEAVTMINLTLADFISKFTKRRMTVFDWPMITCGKRVVHPIYYMKGTLPNLKEMGMTPPWDMIKIVEPDVYFGLALNKQGDVVCVAPDNAGLRKLDKTTGKWQPYCLSPSQDKHSKHVHDLAVDEDDTVYALSRYRDVRYTLSVYTSSGRNTHHRTLEFMKGLVPKHIRITVTKDKNIVIACDSDIEEHIKAWLCDCHGELRNSFVVDQTKDHSLKLLSVSCNNEVMLITRKHVVVVITVYKLQIYTKNGQLQKTVKFSPSDVIFHPKIHYNEVTKNIICLNNLHNSELVEFFSDQSGALSHSFLLYDTNLPHLQCPNLVCHTNGTLALVDKTFVLFLQKPT